MWRSILATRKVIERGSRWCIGNGESVQIWKDRWIPNPDSCRVISQVGAHSGLERVSSLLDTERRGWNVARVRNTFLPHEDEMVLSIPISAGLPADSIVWAGITNGKFTVKSAYKVAQKAMKENPLRGEEGGSSDNSRMKAIWKIVWCLSCPNKIKHLLWRACKNILPTKLRLKSRGVGEDDRCDMCGLGESSGHALWSCQLVEAVWSCAKFKLPHFRDPPGDFIDIVWAFIDNHGEVNRSCLLLLHGAFGIIGTI